MREYTPKEQKRIDLHQSLLHEVNSKRIAAMNSRDASKYRDLCEFLGVEPELPELIERAEADELYDSKMPAVKKILKPRKNAANPAKYRDFLEDAKSCDYDQFSADSDEKRNILKKHFAISYDKQKMFGYDDHKLGVVFKKIVDSAQDVVTRDY